MGSGDRWFRCRYTGVPLDDQRGGRRYPTWEHVTSGDESNVLLVADLINRMKSDLTDAEFRSIVKALARTFGGATFDPAAFPTGPS
ncbi:hypothetical protein D0Z08_25890 [Nocardioides immobilis]|uniref:Uncharacterized protein n=1 Tax=Nocardioides immobilis TaxID=2049295 RepID=A0A417XUH1_9ACTN|nr:hypothetical protein D0Z08_25890 [Nocardioides immobilis]